MLSFLIGNSDTANARRFIRCENVIFCSIEITVFEEPIAKLVKSPTGTDIFIAHIYFSSILKYSNANCYINNCDSNCCVQFILYIHIQTQNRCYSANILEMLSEFLSTAIISFFYALPEASFHVKMKEALWRTTDFKLARKTFSRNPIEIEIEDAISPITANLLTRANSQHLFKLFAS